MSSLSFCSLDQAFNDSSSEKKEKKKKKSKSDNFNPLSKTFVNNNRSSNSIVENPSIDMMPNPPTPEYAAVTQVQRREEPLPVQSVPRDMPPNNLQNSLNNESIQLFKNMQEQILVLTNELNNIKNSSNSSFKDERKSIVEGFNSKSITFDNDQFNELLLYIFTGVFMLYIIDYMYKFGKKSF